MQAYYSVGPKPHIDYYDVSLQCLIKHARCAIKVKYGFGALSVENVHFKGRGFKFPNRFEEVNHSIMLRFSDYLQTQ